MIFMLCLMLLLLTLLWGCKSSDGGSKQENAAGTESIESSDSEERTADSGTNEEEAEVTEAPGVQTNEAAQKTGTVQSAEDVTRDSTTEEKAYDPYESVRDELNRLYSRTQSRSDEIHKEIDDGYLDQQTMNAMMREDYENWDLLLNQIWSYLKDTLDEEEMSALSERQKDWVVRKEKAVEEAGKEMEGGSMQPFLEAGEAAFWTKTKVKELMEAYVADHS